MKAETQSALIKSNEALAELINILDGRMSPQFAQTDLGKRLVSFFNQHAYTADKAAKLVEKDAEEVLKVYEPTLTTNAPIQAAEADRVIKLLEEENIIGKAIMAKSDITLYLTAQVIPSIKFMPMFDNLKHYSISGSDKTYLSVADVKEVLVPSILSFPQFRDMESKITTIIHSK